MTILHLYESHSQDPAFGQLLSRLEESVHNVVGDASETEGINLVHAHSWLQDGPTALQLKRDRAIPYVLSLSDEDLVQLEKFTLRPRPYKILEEAEKVVFPSMVFQNVLAEKLPAKLADVVFSHSLMIFPHIDPFWFQHLHLAKPVSLIHIRLLTANIGGRENYSDLIEKAEHRLHKRNFQVELTSFDFKSASLEERMELYRRHDILVHPSRGIVPITLFAEALSQGLPVIYAREGCFDGIFPEGTAGFAVSSHDTADLAEKILLVSERYATMEQHVADLHPLHLFNLDETYHNYLRIYDRVMASGVAGRF